MTRSTPAETSADTPVADATGVLSLAQRLSEMAATPADVEWSVHPPTRYIDCHQSQLLPHWRQPVGSVLLMLQRSPIPLIGTAAGVDVIKSRLRDRALTMGDVVVHALTPQDHLTALFDPKTGLPVTGPVGMPLNDVAVVQTLLNYRSIRQGCCTCVCHPQWGLAVYPTTLLSTASPSQLSLLSLTLLRVG